MKFLKRIRSKSRLKNNGEHQISQSIPDKSAAFDTNFPFNPTDGFPQQLLEELLSYVCPHAQGGIFCVEEDSLVDRGCALCDMRDLARCAVVNRQWCGAAQDLL